MKKVFIGLLIMGISVNFIACNNQLKNSNVNNQVSSVNTKVNNSNQNIKNNVNNNQSKITVEQAKEIALKHANLSGNQVTFIKAGKEIDDGIEKYDMKFYFDNKEYDYDINANTGEIISYDYDIGNYNHNKQSINNQSKITIEQAKEIALKHANLSGNQVTFIKAGKEIDDGIEKYDIKFYFDNKEYDYDINASTGEIVSFDYE
ncbi:PepSY domain-containing protein [Clostridium perfringens]|uniref:PepSY domain-containing protein n=1 Tax=Clostridium perfringens TaxID=1502 RepID=UPI003CEA1FDC